MKTSDLIPYARNAKQHPEEQVAQNTASIREFGMNDPVTVWHDKDGTPVIVEGHGRVLALHKLNIEECPVICLDDLTDSQRRAYTLIHNQLTINTGWDADILGVGLEDLTADFDYDYTIPEVTEHFTGEIVIPDNWQIGVIVGASGPGKTTIARELFGDCFTPLPEQRNPSVIMDMPQGHSVSEITRMFTSLGFSGPYPPDCYFPGLAGNRTREPTGHNSRQAYEPPV